jgi:diguanylate cyclase (GGDEF)-like protein/PAS domain S-box-containing protein
MIDRPDKTLSARFPEAAPAIHAKASGTKTTEQGLFLWTSVKLSRNLGQRSLHSPGRKGERSWILLSFVPRSYLNGLRADETRTTLRFYILIIFFTGIFSLVLAKQIKDRLRIRAALAESENHYRLLAENAADVIWTMEIGSGVLRYISPSVERLLGWSAEALTGKTLDSLLSPENREKSHKSFRHFTGKARDAGNRHKTLEAELLRSDGSVLTAEVNLSLLNGYADAEPLVLGVTRDVTERKRLEVSLRELSEEDALTGIFNRRKFDELLGKELRVARRYKRPLTAIMFDIDRFKQVNDNYGHEVGDEVLKRLAEVVRKVLRDTDQFFRYGGEEFVVLAPETTLPPGESLAERIRLTVATTQFSGPGTITVSLGVAVFAGETDQQTFLKRVDTALYRSKQEGRNRCTVG